MANGSTTERKQYQLTETSPPGKIALACLRADVQNYLEGTNHLTPASAIAGYVRDAGIVDLPVETRRQIHPIVIPAVRTAFAERSGRA